MTDEEIAIEAVRNLGYGDYPKTTSAESAFGYAAAVEALRIALPSLRPEPSEAAARSEEASTIAGLIAEAREVLAQWDRDRAWMPRSPLGMIERLADALEAAPSAHPAEGAGHWEDVTNRGFGITSIETDNGLFTVKESSLATERRVWIGLSEGRAHLTVAQATRARDALSAFITQAVSDD